MGSQKKPAAEFESHVPDPSATMPFVRGSMAHLLDDDEDEELAEVDPEPLITPMPAERLAEEAPPSHDDAPATASEVLPILAGLAAAFGIGLFTGASLTAIGMTFARAYFGY